VMLDVGRALFSHASWSSGGNSATSDVDNW
jgi:hypothetical protein